MKQRLCADSPYALPETNSEFTPENWCLEVGRWNSFLGRHIFRDYVSFREGKFHITHIISKIPLSSRHRSKPIPPNSGQQLQKNTWCIFSTPLKFHIPCFKLKRLVNEWCSVCCWDSLYVFFFLASYVPFIFSKETYKLHKDARRKLIHGALVETVVKTDKRLNFQFVWQI